MTNTAAPDDEAAATVALMRRRASGWSALGDEILAAGSAAAVLRGERSGQLALDESAQREALPGELDQATIDVQAWRHAGIDVIPLTSARYPRNLLATPARPPLVFLRGSINAQDGRAVAVVGSRRSDASRCDWARLVSAALAQAGVTIISGLAEGIDAAAHRGALEVGGRTLGVLGSGLEQMWPPSNQSLAMAISQSGAVMSQFWPEQRPSRRTFPMRNAVISGLSRAVVVASGKQGSGTQIQAELAVRQGRPLLVHESTMSEEWVERALMRGLVIEVGDPQDAVSVVLEAIA